MKSFVEVDANRYADELLKLAANELRGSTRRIFLSKVCDGLCAGNARQAENHFGLGRNAIAERAATESGDAPLVTSDNRGKQRSENVKMRTRNSPSTLT